MARGDVDHMLADIVGGGGVQGEEDVHLGASGGCQILSRMRRNMLMYWAAADQ